MPELPEVETVCRTLNELLPGKKIDKVDVRLPRIIQEPDDIQQFCFLLKDQTFREVTRRGKFIRFVLDDYVLISHLRMEGRYGMFPSSEPIELHTHVIFSFTDGTELRYKDVRQFGTMHVFPIGQEFTQKPLEKLGLEPLSEDFSLEAFRQVFRKCKTKIKPLLLNQHYLVGLGNIYVDEALFYAGIHPEKCADRLRKDDWRRLHEAIITILTEAVNMGGSSVKSYVNGQGEMGMFQQQLRVYGKQGQPCMQCGLEISKTVVGGRGTHFCWKCQPHRKLKMHS